MLIIKDITDVTKIINDIKYFNNNLATIHKKYMLPPPTVDVSILQQEPVLSQSTQISEMIDGEEFNIIMIDTEYEPLSESSSDVESMATTGETVFTSPSIDINYELSDYTLETSFLIDESFNEQ